MPSVPLQSTKTVSWSVPSPAKDIPFLSPPSASHLSENHTVELRTFWSKKRKNQIKMALGPEKNV